ncbi:hypothetical protein EG68_10877 [Paragonimus skrjabini miyazakii]|uniref:Carnitine O-palmitoyltransferase n=1 Tax=Paragonimus skrjabini miyazakii TaxID=59628 RepID=A0A8S9YNM0_9TREM|nr:hypothetical protein EG68_10877 [Paragonimus skrjabini miyazakii]
MAEAHAAVAFTFTVSSEGLYIDINKQAWEAVLRSGIRAGKKRIARFKNSVYNQVYPFHPSSWFFFAFGIFAATYLGYDYKRSPIPYIEEALKRRVSHQSLCFLSVMLDFYLISLETSLFYLLVYCVLSFQVRGIHALFSRACLPALFSHAVVLWLLFESALSAPPTQLHRLDVQTQRSEISAGLHLDANSTNSNSQHQVHLRLKRKQLVRLAKSRHSRLYGYQYSLPSLPLPSLRATLDRYLLSVRHLLTVKEFEELTSESEVFRKGHGRKLQFFLWLKTWFTSNYVSFMYV